MGKEVLGKEQSCITNVCIATCIYVGYKSGVPNIIKYIISLQSKRRLEFTKQKKWNFMDRICVILFRIGTMCYSVLIVGSRKRIL